MVWDLIRETGEFKLRGHKDQITGLQFLEPEAQEEIDEDGEKIMSNGGGSSQGFLLTTSKDALIKLWDLTSQHHT